MNKLPTLKQLQHLITLFDYQHFGKAAEACFISQSTMSASIAQLEELLGVQLLERGPKAFIFTSLGENIVERSRKLMENAQDLMDYVHNDGKPMHGVIRLGCIPTIAPFMMGDLLLNCNKMYPALKLLIREDTTDNLLHSLETGQIDTIILALPYSTINVHTEILCQDPFHLIYPRSLADKIEEKELNSWPDECIFLLGKEHCLTQHTLQACSLKNSKKINPFFASSLHTLTQMVSSGLGVTFLPQLAIKSGILANSGLSDLYLPNNTAHREIGMAWRFTSHKQDNYLLLADLVKTVLLQLIG
jgi:LysR family hydrogen peroxide-inducible transcriptional activator